MRSYRRVVAECRRWRTTETMISTHRPFPGPLLPVSIILPGRTLVTTSENPLHARSRANTFHALG
jgi:hypothetical protein